MEPNWSEPINALLVMYCSSFCTSALPIPAPVTRLQVSLLAPIVVSHPVPLVVTAWDRPS